MLTSDMTLQKYCSPQSLDLGYTPDFHSYFIYCLRNYKAFRHHFPFITNGGKSMLSLEIYAPWQVKMYTYFLKTGSPLL